jgi:hypothetical protein
MIQILYSLDLFTIQAPISITVGLSGRFGTKISFPRSKTFSTKDEIVGARKALEFFKVFPKMAFSGDCLVERDIESLLVNYAGWHSSRPSDR